MEVNYWLDFLVEFLATLCGIAVALVVSHLYENWKRSQKIESIVPYIYMELSENLNIIRTKKGRFITNYWEVYRGVLGNWNEEQIVKIIKIYNFMEFEGSVDYAKYKTLKQIDHLICEVILWFEKRTKSNPASLKRMKQVEKYFSEMQDSIMKPMLMCTPQYYPHKQTDSTPN